MPPIPMVALKSCIYAGRRMRVGDEFDMSGKSDAGLYHALGWADFALARPEQVVPVPVHSPLAVPTTTAALASQALPLDADEPTPEPAPEDPPPAESEGGETDAQPTEQTEQEVEISPRTGKPLRHYKRRDMTAES